MREPGTRTRQALLIALGAACLAGANALTTGAAPESSRELSGLALEVLGAALMALGLCGLLLRSEGTRLNSSHVKRSRMPSSA